MKWPWRWESGRRSPCYQKLRIISWWLFDIWILKFPPGCEISPHRDKVPDKNHHRLNITIQEAELGGVFYVVFKPSQLGGALKLYCHKLIKKFRPDICTHGQTIVKGSKTKYMLSIGWVTK